MEGEGKGDEEPKGKGKEGLAFRTQSRPIGWWFVSFSCLFLPYFFVAFICGPPGVGEEGLC